MKKHILIVGKNSYIGSSICNYLEENYSDSFEIDTISVRDDAWKEMDFSVYSGVVNCIGIAHLKETEKNRDLYYRINRDLPIEIAEKSKKDGVNQFVLLSSMSVYGKEVGHICKHDVPNPVSAYGKSKLEADNYINGMSCDGFSVACIRPPMVYGKSCKGNYQSLRKLALKSPVFPTLDNERSMIYIENLCEFIRRLIENKKEGLFFPQNNQYVHTREMVRLIAEENGKSIHFLGMADPILRKAPVSVVKKAFGSLTYEPCDLVDMIAFEESIKKTEKK